MYELPGAVGLWPTTQKWGQTTAAVTVDRGLRTVEVKPQNSFPAKIIVLCRCISGDELLVSLAVYRGQFHEPQCELAEAWLLTVSSDSPVASGLSNLTRTTRRFSTCSTWNFKPPYMTISPLCKIWPASCIKNPAIVI